MKIAICVSGQPRFANFGAFHQKKFVNGLPFNWHVDFYLQTWSQEGVEENAERMFGAYGKAPLRIDPQYRPTEYPDFFHKIRGLSQHYAHYLCMQQIKNPYDYDLIIRTRHDTMLNWDVMADHVMMMLSIHDTGGIAGYGFYPDYNDEPDVAYLKTSAPSHRGFSKYPTVDDWALVAATNQWQNYWVTENEFNRTLDAMFMDPENEHISASYELEGEGKRVCIPERVWYNLFQNPEVVSPILGKGHAYLARPTLRNNVNVPVESMTPSMVRSALRKGWVNGAAVLQYAIML